MAHLDIHKNPGQGGGYVVDIQAPLLAHLKTRVVIPLLPHDTAPLPAKGLNPIFELGGADHVLATQFMSAVMTSELGPPMGSLRQHRDEIIRAVDIVLTGV